MALEEELQALPAKQLQHRARAAGAKANRKAREPGEPLQEQQEPQQQGQQRKGRGQGAGQPGGRKNGSALAIPEKDASRTVQRLVLVATVVAALAALAVPAYQRGTLWLPSGRSMAGAGTADSDAGGDHAAGASMNAGSTAGSVCQFNASSALEGLVPTAGGYGKLLPGALLRLGSQPAVALLVCRSADGCAAAEKGVSAALHEHGRCLLRLDASQLGSNASEFKSDLQRFMERAPGGVVLLERTEQMSPDLLPLLLDAISQQGAFNQSVGVTLLMSTLQPPLVFEKLFSEEYVRGMARRQVVVDWVLRAEATHAEAVQEQANALRQRIDVVLLVGEDLVRDCETAVAEGPELPELPENATRRDRIIAAQALRDLGLEMSSEFTNVARVFADVNAKAGEEYWDYKNMTVEWGRLEDYELGDMIGSGICSNVYAAVHRETGARVVIKTLTRLRKPEIPDELRQQLEALQMQQRDRRNSAGLRKEMKALQALQGGPNIVHLIGAVMDAEEKNISLVFERVDAAEYKSIFRYVSDFDARYYVMEVLKALDYAHSKGIMHRDMRPENILINPERRQVTVIDWGLAEFYRPGKLLPPKVADRKHMAPELLLNMLDYDYSIDMWSLGTIVMGIIFRVPQPVFNGRGTDHQMMQYCKLLGLDELDEMASKYGISIKKGFAGRACKGPHLNWNLLINDKNRDIVNPEALSFLDGLLRYDPKKRMTAREAMQHPWLAPVRAAAEQAAAGAAEDVTAAKGDAAAEAA